MGTQAKKAPREETAIPTQVVHSDQGNTSAAQFYHVCYVIYGAVSCFLSTAEVEEPISINGQQASTSLVSWNVPFTWYCVAIIF